MNLRRIGILFVKEVRQGATNFFLVYAIVMPIVLSLLVTLVFGDLFSETPRLGLYDAGSSEMVTIMTGQDHLETTIYGEEAALRDDVDRGVVTAGLIFPAGFDAALADGQRPQLTTLYSSEGLAKNIAIINSAVDQALGQITAVEPLVTIQAVQLGDEQVISWTERLLPVIVLMCIIVGGAMVPAASLVDEKVKRTLSALTITPTTLLEVYVAKALLGIGVSVLMGLIVLVLNNAFGGQPVLLVTTLVLGAVASAIFGVLLGSLINEINMLLAVIKASGIVLFAPAIIQIVPEVPQWIARVFPTFYVLNPVLEVSQHNAGLGEIAGDIAILLAIMGAMILALVFVIERQQKQLALAS
jgi:ABC-2 type transport system permease protein